LWEHYQPADIGEELQVEIVATCLWRERRALRCELGEVGHAQVENREGNRMFDKIPDSQSGPGEVLRILKTAESELKKDAVLSSKTGSALWKALGWEELDEATMEKIRTGQEQDLKKISQRQNQVGRKIRSMIEELERFLRERQESEQRGIIERYAIPDSEALNRLLRYQALNDRRLQRALTQLERLQRRRKGDYVPPPVKVAVDGPLGGE
jgi:phage protein D